MASGLQLLESCKLLREEWKLYLECEEQNSHHLPFGSSAGLEPRLTSPRTVPEWSAQNLSPRLRDSTHLTRTPLREAFDALRRSQHCDVVSPLAGSNLEKRVIRLRVAVVASVMIVPLLPLIAYPAWTVDLGLDVWNLPELHARVRAAARRDQELTSESAQARRRIEVKEVLIADLIAGRRTLADVALQFSVLNEGVEVHLTILCLRYPDTTDGERTLRNVIEFTQHRVSHLPTWQRLAILTQLDGQRRVIRAGFAAADQPN